MIPIFLDCETRACSRISVRERVAADIAPPGNYKSAEAIAKWWSETGNAKRAEAVERTALDGTWGEIVCIGLAVKDGPVSIIGGSELAILRSLNAELQMACDGEAAWQRRACYVGHNVAAFDLRFIWQRSRIHGIALPVWPLERYPRGPYVYDTMTEWAGFGGRISQRNLELAFGLERTDPLENGGADVAAALDAGRVKDVYAHCREDVRLLREIYRRMSGWHEADQS
jgi:hypothetical protein